MKVLSIRFGNIGNQRDLRCDANYRYFFDVKKARTWDLKNEIELSQILFRLNSSKVKKGVLEDEEHLVDLTNIDRRYNHLSNISTVTEIGSDKSLIQYGDMIIPKMQPRMGNLFTNLKKQRLLCSSELIEYKVNDNIYLPNYLYYVLTIPDFQQSLLYTESGKTHRRVSPYDLLKYKIPQISIDTQKRSLVRIEEIEKDINSLRKQLKSITETINSVFSDYFKIDFTISDKKNRDLIYFSHFCEVANEELKFDISLKYRKIFRSQIYEPSDFNWKPLSKIANIKGGKRLPKGEDVIPEDTGYKYIRVDDLDRFGHFDLENIQYITKENHEKIKNYIAKEGDILLTIVGATVGKCGVLPKELDGENISENFARLIINNSEEYKSLYILYTLMSKFGQYQINEYKGRGSQGKLAIFRIKKIMIPDILPSEQTSIIDKIHLEIEKQKNLLIKMEVLRKEIDNILYDDIKRLKPNHKGTDN